jgi:cell division protein FtsW
MNSYARSSGQPRRLVLDPWVIGPVAALLLIGLVMVASASIGISEKETGEAFHYFQRQFVYVCLGLVAAVIGLAVPTRIWEEKSIYLLAGAFAMLVLVLIPGVGYEVNGARRWIRLGIMNFQVSELARVMLLTYVASYAVRRADDLRGSFAGFIKPVLVLVGAAVLLLIEPDFGAAAVLFATGLAVLFIAGARFVYLLVPIVFGGLALAALAVFSPYRLRRLTGFLDPWGDPFNSGFQLVQSLIAIGRGEWFGVGLGASVEKLMFLPEAHTDFLLAVIGEEFGLVGVLTVIGLFLWLTRRLMHIGRQAIALDRVFAGLVAQGVGIWVGFQAFINMGVNLGALPTKGLTLPFMSYGGSAILINLVAIAVVLRIDVENRQMMRGGRV